MSRTALNDQIVVIGWMSKYARFGFCCGCLDFCVVGVLIFVALGIVVGVLVIVSDLVGVLVIGYISCRCALASLFYS